MDLRNNIRNCRYSHLLQGSILCKIYYNDISNNPKKTYQRIIKITFMVVWCYPNWKNPLKNH
jgi:hypothetical protein